ncbi:hypothetical protein JVU11DRAFT_2562 [Chiua virens]|nr:hypothetical protein JVU11DRAFT_2562 [Chiua virens]
MHVQRHCRSNKRTGGWQRKYERLGNLSAIVFSAVHGHDYNFKDDTLGVDLAYEEAAQDNEKGDIKVEYHPHSGYAQEVHQFLEYQKNQASKSVTPCHKQPWEPFHSCLDFKIAELMLHAALNKNETNWLISLIHCAVGGKESFSLTSHKEINEIWSGASHCFTPFECTMISVPYLKDTHQFNVYSHLLWDWVIDLLSHPHIGPHTVFDAEWLYKYDGSTFI